MNEVEQFIESFSKFGTQVIKCFTEGNCYWFANILHKRFPYSDILINNVENHFACKIDDDIYDITGICNDTYDGEWIDWEEYQCDEPVQAKRIIEYCVLLTK